MIYDEAPTNKHQTSLFDSTAGRLAKERGQERAAANNLHLREYGRQVARQHPKARIGITADDVTEELIRRGMKESEIDNWMGSLFLTGEWIDTGRWERARRVKSKARKLTVWRLK